MRARGLGSVEVRVGTRWVPPVGRLQRTLLGVLLARAGELVPSDHLVDALWGGARDDRAAARLQVHVHRLRKRVEDPGLVVTEDGGYRLALSPDEVDWQCFDTLADSVLATERGDPTRADRAREALALWRGSAFEGVDHPLCERVAERLAERRLAVTEVLHAEEVGRGAHDAVLPQLAALATEHPLRESLQALLMAALHQSGRQDEALAVFRQTRARLVEELGVAPSPVLLDMHDRVLAGEAMAVTGDTAGPAQLPAPPRRLTGRDGALATLDEVLLGPRSAPLVVLCGPAGVGKSALALGWAHGRLADFPDGQLFADLRGFSRGDPLAPDLVLDGFLRALGANPRALRGVEERSAQLRSLLAGRRMLMVLDNARSAEQVRPLLPGTATVTVVVTSRQSLSGLAVRDGAERIGLGLLSPGDAVGLLEDLVETPTSRDQLELLAQRCAHLPLALRVAAERVNTDPEGVWSMLEDGVRALDVLDAGDDPSTSAREVFSWSYRALSPAAARVLRAMGVLPGASADLDALVALAGMPRPEVSRAATELVRTHLAELDGSHYRQHDLLAEYAAERALEEEDDARAAMLARLLDHYVVRAEDAESILEFAGTGATFDTAGQALDWLDHNREAIAHAADQAPPSSHPSVIALVQHLRRHLNNGGHRSSARRLYGAASRLVEAGGHTDDAALVAGALGSLLVRTGDVEQGRAHLERAMRLSISSGDELRQAAAVNNLGVMNSATGHLHEAERLFRESHALCLRAGEEVRGETPRSNIASILVDRAEYEPDERLLVEGMAELEDLLVVARRHGLRTREAFGLRAVGLASLRRGDPDAALDAASRAVELARDLGDLVNEGESEVALGRVHLALAEPQAAELHLHRALAMARPVGETQLLAEAQLWLAVLRAVDDPAAAVPLFEECAALGRRFGLGLREADACLGEAAARDVLGLEGANRLRSRGRMLLEERGLSLSGRQGLVRADAGTTAPGH